MKKITVSLFCLLAVQFTKADCEPPANLMVSDITETDVTISWDSPETLPEMYQYCIVTDGIPNGEGAPAIGDVTEVAEPPTSASTLDPDTYDLEPGTTYQVFIRAFCVIPGQAPDWGDWSEGVSFTTLSLPTCPPPSNLTVSDITETDVTISWDSPETLPEFYQYSIVTDGIPVPVVTINGVAEAAEPPTSASTLDPDTYDLEPGTTYQVFIRAFCVNGGDAAFGEWSEGVSFTTLSLPTCVPPSNISISDITETDISISWDSPESMPLFYQYCIVSDSIPDENGLPIDSEATSVSTVGQTQYDLEPGTTYQVFIRSYCFDETTGIPDFGEWSEPVSFTTPNVLSVKADIFYALKVYPNPASSVVTISNGHSIDMIEVHNILGKKVFSKTYRATKMTLDMTDFTTGVYFMTILSNGAKSTLKLIKE